MTRELSHDEVRNRFLKAVRGIARFWAEDVDNKTPQERCDGVAFSILALLDGCNASMPGFIVAPLPAEEDKQYHIDCNDDYYYPENHESDVACDIAGGLHELYYRT